MAPGKGVPTEDEALIRQLEQERDGKQRELADMQQSTVGGVVKARLSTEIARIGDRLKVLANTEYGPGHALRLKVREEIRAETTPAAAEVVPRPTLDTDQLTARAERRLDADLALIRRDRVLGEGLAAMFPGQNRECTLTAGGHSMRFIRQDDSRIVVEFSARIPGEGNLTARSRSTRVTVLPSQAIRAWRRLSFQPEKLGEMFRPIAERVKSTAQADRTSPEFNLEEMVNNLAEGRAAA